VNDLWEHAYYLKHENRRPEYLDGWWPLVDWDEAGRRFRQSDLQAPLNRAAGGELLREAS
jgi:superoxide dismutase